MSIKRGKKRAKKGEDRRERERESEKDSSLSLSLSKKKPKGQKAHQIRIKNSCNSRYG